MKVNLKDPIYGMTLASSWTRKKNKNVICRVQLSGRGSNTKQLFGNVCSVSPGHTIAEKAESRGMKMKLVDVLLIMGSILALCNVQVLPFPLDRPLVKRRGQSSLSLRPSQGSELEACAYELMKEALVRQSQGRSHPFSTNYFSEPPPELLEALQKIHSQKRTTNYAGPLSWLRTKIWPGKGANREEPSGSSRLLP